MKADKLPAFVALSLCIIPLISTIAIAQNSYLDEPGIPAFTTSFPVEHGFINLANGNLHIEIPIADYPQRGNIKALHPRLVYDSRFWIVRIDPVSEASTWVPGGIGSVGAHVGGEWRLITDGESGITSSTMTSKVGCYISGQPLSTRS